MGFMLTIEICHVAACYAVCNCFIGAFYRLSVLSAMLLSSIDGSMKYLQLALK